MKVNNEGYLSPHMTYFKYSTNNQAEELLSM